MELFSHVPPFVFCSLLQDHCAESFYCLVAHGHVDFENALSDHAGIDIFLRAKQS